MDETALHALMREKFKDGRLPHDSIPRFWGVNGDGEVCDACDKHITNQQLMIEGLAWTLADKKPYQFHVRCFQLWEAERREPREPTA